MSGATSTRSLRWSRTGRASSTGSPQVAAARLQHRDRSTVGHREMPGLSRMTFTVDGAEHDIEQVTKQLYKVIEVVKITDITDDSSRRARAGADQGRRRRRRTAAPSSRSSTCSAPTSSTSAPTRSSSK